MESHFEDRNGPAGSARDALDAIGADRERVGQRMTAETWWAAPTQGFGTALLVAAPAVGIPWAALLFAASASVFICVEVLFRKRSGLSINRPAGPAGVALLVVLGVLLIGALGTSMVLAIAELHGWSLTVAAAAGVVTALGVAGYDSLYANEVRRAR